MESANTSQAVEDYCKAIFKLEQRHGEASSKQIAERLAVTPASVTGMLRKLRELGLVHYEPYRGARLTESGRKIALETIRHHRLIELFLAEALGMSWDEVHDEAERLEHVISEALEDRIDAMLGHPQFDPHGDPIPSRSGDMVQRELQLLAQVRAGDHCEVAQVSDHDPELLRYLGALGLYPGTRLRVRGVEPWQGPLMLEIDGRDVIVGRAAAQHVRVLPLPASRGDGAPNRSRGLSRKTQGGER